MHATTTQKLVLPLFILTTPFLVFLNYNSYCFTCAETWLALGGIIFSAVLCSLVMLLGGWKLSALMMALLIMGFIDGQFSTKLKDSFAEWIVILLFTGMQTFVLCRFLKEKFYTIATAVFSTFFIVTLLQIALPSHETDSFFAHRQKSAAHAPRRIIHLILDEHIGVEGIPTDVEGGPAIKNLIMQFYLKNGFQLFGGAYSHYFYTQLSIANMLNFASENSSATLLNGHGPYVLVRNQYFNLLSQGKYHIEVLWPGWFDYCSNAGVVITRCIEAYWGGLRDFSKLALPTSQKLQVLYSRYLIQFSVFTALLNTVVLPFQAKFAALDASIYQWTWAIYPERTRTNSLDTLTDLPKLWKDILSLPHGSALFVHLPFPHYPYVALSDCSIRKPNRYFLWNYRGLFDRPPTNTIESRKQRYQQYFEQLQCLYLRLDELFDRMRAAGVYDDSIILVHGDHGSRIVLTEPTLETRPALTRQDLVDGYSTLFAMKVPGETGGYDKSPRPLEQLLETFAFEAGLTSTKTSSKTAEPYVYLIADGDKQALQIPYLSPH